MRPEVLSGILIVDKPAGMSSAKVVAVVKKMLKVQKAGHTGTLDPFATGALILCLNDATKLARFFLEGEKSYRARLKLGEATETQDATGRIVGRRPWDNVTEAKITALFERFKGRQTQTPPAYSALKHNGEPLYKLARQGRPVQKPPRAINITALEILNIDLPLIDFDVTCSAGTYIRTLCADIGDALGCGGHLAALRRTAGCGFSIRQAVDLACIEQLVAEGKIGKYVIGKAAALKTMPSIQVNPATARKIRYGQPLLVQEADSVMVDQPGGFYKLVDSEDNLLAIVEHALNAEKLSYCCCFNSAG